MTESAIRVRPESMLKHCVSCLMQHVMGKIRKRTKQRGQQGWSPTAKTMKFRYKLSIYYNSSFLGVAVHFVALGHDARLFLKTYCWLILGDCPAEM